MYYHSRNATLSKIRIRFAQRAAGIAAFALLISLGANTAFSQPDILIRDCQADNGAIPSAPGACSTGVYWSPDIWGRLSPDAGTTDQGPIVGAPLYIYIRMKNIGDRMLGCGVLHLYYRDATVGAANWPSDWIARWIGGNITADEIGSVCVCCILPGQTQIVMIPWASVPANKGGYGHHCLLARFVSAEDPMTPPGETSNTYDNIRLNNNIAQKNLANTSPANPNAVVTLFNNSLDPVTTTLKFDALANDNGNNVFDVPGFQVKAVLGADLYALWNGQGQGVQPLPEENAVLITGANAQLDGITLQGRDCRNPVEYAINVQMLYPANIPPDQANDVYNWTIEQHLGGATEAVNGEAFEVHMGDQEPQGKTARPPAPDLGTKLNLHAQPNISAASSRIGFTLPNDAQVTLAIYDGNGALVRTLISKVDQTAGSHEVEWNGLSKDGVKVASGTYFYRLMTPDGTVEKQIKIVR
ncbi:MAG: hypothetical protein JST22_03855 [Bacteroidetes bacterium]|nr:hypothetical protein [Bacteroidota bacterium]